MKAASHKKNGYRLPAFLLILICLLFLSGCWDSREIEKRSAVTALAVDQTDDGDLIVSVQIPIPLKIAGGGEASGGSSPVKVFSKRAKTFQGALEKIQYSVNGKLYFGHTKLIAISTEIAKRGIQPVLDPLRRMEQIRRSLFPVVVKSGKAKDLITLKTDLDKIPANFIRSMIENEIRLGGLPNLTLGQFYVSSSSTAKQPMMLGFELNDKSQVDVTGVSIFRGDRLVGFLNKQRTSQMLQVSNRKSGDLLQAPVTRSGYRVTMEPYLEKVTYDISYKNGKVHAGIVVYLETDVKGITKPVNLSKAKNRKSVRKGVETSLEANAQKMIDKLQTTYQSDVLNIGARVRAFHNDIWQKVDWKKAFPEADINVDYNLRIRRAGMKRGGQ